ncbi:aminopeptidase N [Polymorphospora sp. NPDC051019]|uniref:aminopeptidase N n=1 Tax=Polymorphospora sp. NPDC051019 TaxID=3155725 RepID=UPI003449972F
MPSLTRHEAAVRADRLRVEAYRVELDLAAGRDADHFTSTTTVRFACTRPGATTFVELRPVSVSRVVLNGRTLDPGTLIGNRLPLDDLRADNELVVRATMAFSSTGEGVHRFTDPDDGEVYVHCHAPLDSAQRVFACFDQPDLKAPLTLTLTTPADWTARANAAVDSTVDTADGTRRWEFGATPPVSTYHFTFVAGPWHVRRAEHDGIPLGLFCRRSLAADLDRDADELFAVTGAFLDRYHELFASRYPFAKYDQAFVPELNSGAVENPGCVTFTEDLLFRSAVTDADRELRTVIVAHEMAHMWFGDLVTMRWWDGIWLSESFAEYMGWRVTAEVTAHRDAWTSFTIRRKSWGYVTDQGPSTHPVAPEGVPDTAHALLNFDGISYAKGAAALRQLIAHLGDDTFLAGVRAYFTAHAFANATLDDLLAALGAAAGRDLTGWARLWLRRAQVNTLRPEVALDADGRYRSVTVVQTAPPEHPTLRPHRLAVGVYGTGDAPGTLLRRYTVDLDPTADGGRTPVPGLAGTEPGRLLLLNDGDLTYTKVRLDPADLDRLDTLLGALDDPLARAVVWTAAIDAARDAELSPARFVALAAAGLPTETVTSVFEEVLRFARDFAAARYLPEPAQPAALATLAATCLETLDHAAPGSGRQLAAARWLAACAGPTDTGRLAGWLAGDGVPEGLAVDADLRWTLLYRLVALGAAGETEIADEVRRDPQGIEPAARCRAAVATEQAKERAWAAIRDDDTRSAHLALAAAQGFWHPGQAGLTAPYVDRYFADLPTLAGRRTPTATARIAATAYPRYAVSARTEEAAGTLLGRADVDPVLHRVVLDATDELRRARAARTVT